MAPVVATALVSGGFGWWTFYYILLGTNALELVVGTVVWWDVNGRVFRENVKKSMIAGEKEGGRMGEAVRNKVVWLIAVFFFLYVGAEGESLFHLTLRLFSFQSPLHGPPKFPHLLI